MLDPSVLTEETSDVASGHRDRIIKGQRDHFKLQLLHHFTVESLDLDGNHIIKNFPVVSIRCTIASHAHPLNFDSIAVLYIF